MKKHKLLTHEDCTIKDCIICVRKVRYCEVCGGVDKSLPTDCPGWKMTPFQEISIAAGGDYVDGDWVK